jgi:PAS domain S-box-containing protein
MMGAKPTPGTGNQPLDLSSLCLAITEHAPLPMATVEGSSHIVRYANPAFCRLIDRSKDQLVGKSFCEMLPEKDECVTLLDGVFRTGKPESHTEPEPSEPHPAFWSYTAWPVMGNERPVGVIIQVTESAEFHEKTLVEKTLAETTLAINEALILGSVRQHKLTEAADSSNTRLQKEISERKRTEAQLRASAKEKLLLTERLSLATAVAKVGVWEWDLASNTLTWDATMFDLYGFPPVVPMPYERWSAAVHPEDLAAVESSVQRAIDEKGQGHTEYRIILPDGSVRNVSRIERVVLDEHANVTRVIGVSMDVTKRKKAEQARKDQLRFKDEFLSHVSHELRTPLAAIDWFTTNLLEGLLGDVNAEQREHLETTLSNARQLNIMIDDLLDSTRADTGKLNVALSEMILGDVVAEALASSHARAAVGGVLLRAAIPSGLPTVWADPDRTRQVLINLIDNGVKFTPRDGTITVQVQVADDHDFLRVSVADAGCGISPENRERVFDRLFQISGAVNSSRRGLGLGLFISKELVSLQGGRIWVESEIGHGATFSFTLPVFSLRRLCAPVLSARRLQAGTMSLITVKTFPGDETAETKARRLSDARKALESSIVARPALLLPQMFGPKSSEPFFIVANTNGTGAAAIEQKIEQQLAQDVFRQNAQQPPTVSVTMVEWPTLAESDFEHTVTRVVSRLNELVNATVSVGR